MMATHTEEYLVAIKKKSELKYAVNSLQDTLVSKKARSKEVGKGCCYLVNVLKFIHCCTLKSCSGRTTKKVRALFGAKNWCQRGRFISFVY